MPAKTMKETLTFYPIFNQFFPISWNLPICPPLALVYNHLLNCLLHSVDKEETALEKLHGKKSSNYVII